ncbi:flippase-like domain-containing protein [Rubrobacter tropicus]|uniref:Flippase-like domain-containing protein n=1 Tax=Rubrobacter tropicus TaxID=2653851 RepID=A0A6G8QAQ7_9ACTN|nr:lysylphosphatidylglycerol synthase transmembrane domain-containing protein [Rubrobacter tropicus]QIN83570.1 flippase-like domain-containing protein [Rubrobacter tropicus]
MVPAEVKDGAETGEGCPSWAGEGQLKPWFYRFAGIFVSVFFVYLAARQVDFSESLRALGAVRPARLVAATLVYLSSFPIRALRWRLILRVQKAIPLKELMAAVFIGYMANNVLPARAGEVYRAHYLGRRAGVSRSGVAASIVVERTLDGLMLVCAILFVFVAFPQEDYLGGAAIVTGLVFLALATGILFYGLRADRTHRAIGRTLGLVPEGFRKRLVGRLGSFSRGIRGISTARELLEAGAYTVLVWVLDACAVALVVASFGVTLPAAGYVLVFALVALSTTLPSGPGFVGPFQYAFVLSLGAFAVSRETALAVSVVAQLSLLGSVTLIGLALLWREQLRASGR